MATILVTGGAGYIGSHTCVELLKEGYDVIIVDNLYNSKAKVVDRIETITGRRPIFYKEDVCDEQAMERIFNENQIDAAIHFAGLKAVGESVEKPLAYYQNNLDSTLVLLKTMARHQVKKFIFSSSATVYGMPERVPITEDFPVSCTNPYGWTKLMIEQILRDVYQADGEWSIILLRYFNPIGAHASGMIGEDPRGIPNNLLPYVSQVALGKLKQLQVFGDDYPTVDGTGVRDYIHVVDLAKGHVKALAYAGKNHGVEAVNLGTGNGYSVLQIVKAFETANNVSVPYRIVERRAGDVAICYADASKAERLLGWKAELGINEMCRDTWNWQTKNPDGYGEDE